MKQGWEVVPLGDVLVERTERIGSPDADGLPLLGVSNTGGLHRSGKSRISDMSRYLLVKRDWFAYNPMRINVGSLGWAYSDELAGVISPDYVVFSATEKVLPRLVYLFLRSHPGLQAINLQAAGSVRQRLYYWMLAEIRIPLPPPPEQQRIVAKVEDLTAKIEEAHQLQQIAVQEALFFSNVVSSEAFPAGGASRVGDFVEIQSGYAFKSEWFSDSGIRLVRNVNIGHGKIEWADVARIPEDMSSQFQRFALERGDILVSLDRPLISTGLKAARVRDEDLPSLLLQRVARVRFRGDDLLPDYFYRWLNSRCFTGAIDPGRSNGVPHISPGDITRLPFSPPPLPEQRRIVAYLDDLQAKVDALKVQQAQSAAELDALLPSVLDKAFKGEL
jgi:restriction endonuclease S subunit